MAEGTLLDRNDREIDRNDLTIVYSALMHCLNRESSRESSHRNNADVLAHAKRSVDIYLATRFCCVDDTSYMDNALNNIMVDLPELAGAIEYKLIN